MRLLGALGLVVPALAAATTYPVGPSRAYVSPCALVAAVTLGAGDVIEVDPGTYHDACQLTASGSAAAPIVLRGLPGARPVFDATGLDLSGVGSVPRAIFQFTGGSFWLVQHVELTSASNASLNGAAFRATAGSHDIVIEDVSVHDCQDGFMSDGVASVTVRWSDIFHNGAGDGYSHNFYLQGQSTVLIGNHIHDSVGGQNVKIRSHDALLAYNRIENAGNYEIDLIQAPPATSQPNANVALIGNVIVRPPSADNNSQVILWGTDNPSDPARNGSLYAVNNTFLMQNGSNRLFHAINPAAGSQIVFQNNIVAATVSGTGLATDATTSAILLGSTNWLQSNITTAGALSSSLVGTSPGFVGGGDYHLVAGAQEINAGLPGLSYVDGIGATQSAVPTSEFSSPAGVTPRGSDGQIDLGAYEKASSAPPDGGTTPDAGTTPDGGTDGGVPDAGNPGGGTGGPGGGAPSPGIPGGGTAVQGGCSVGPGASPWALLVGAALVVAVRLRGRRRR
jgi:hypothetical protein